MSLISRSRTPALRIRRAQAMAGFNPGFGGKIFEIDPVRAQFADARIVYKPMETVAATLVRIAMEKNPRIKNLKIRTGSIKMADSLATTGIVLDGSMLFTTGTYTKPQGATVSGCIPTTTATAHNAIRNRKRKARIGMQPCS